MRGLRARRQDGARRPARLPHQRAFRPRLLRPRVQPSARRLHRRNAPPGTPGHGGLRRRHGQHRHHADSASRRCISTTAASRRPARRCRRCCTSCCNDEWEGKGLDHPDVRNLFTREYLLASDWYAARLKAKQSVDRALWKRHIEYLGHFLHKPSHAVVAAHLGIADRLTRARKMLEEIESPDYVNQLTGTLGAEPMEGYR